MYMKLGQEIRNLRESKKLTQLEVAQKLGMSRQRLARIESGKSDISFAFLEPFAQLVGKTVVEITSVLEQAKPSDNTAFRSVDIDGEESFKLVEDMLDLFYANKHLYERVNG